MAADEESVPTERSNSNGAYSAHSKQLILLQNSKLQLLPAGGVPNPSELPRSESRRNFGTLAGNGDESYAKNSSAQGHAVQTILPLLNDAVNGLALPNFTMESECRGPLVIADLGCASGPNTLKNVDAIVTRLKARFAAERRLQPEPSFQIFFQDLPSNDFNNLFRLVTEANGFGGAAADGKPHNHCMPLKYFVAGVPGSFYGRLFPNSSIHVVFSSYCLHWLSKVPEAIVDKQSPAFNKGKCWVNGTPREVAAAYSERAAVDLKNFLRARAAEVVSGGLVFLLFMGRQNVDPTRVADGAGLPAILWDLLDTVFDQMAAEGLISEELRHSFNCATYFRSVVEVQEVMERCSSEWRILKLEGLPLYHFAEYLARYDTRPGESPRSFARRVLLMYKATQAPQILAHIGPHLSEVFWNKYESMFFSDYGIVEDFYSRIENPGNPATQILLSLIRK
ncbi:unnamed protein product [Calypogeia fissa]